MIQGAAVRPALQYGGQLLDFQQHVVLYLPQLAGEALQLGGGEGGLCRRGQQHPAAAVLTDQGEGKAVLPPGEKAALGLGAVPRGQVERGGISGLQAGQQPPGGGVQGGDCAALQVEGGLGDLI